VEVLGVERVGQITGSTHVTRWPASKDAEGLALLTDMVAWGITGVDLGANIEHAGRSYVFFGDVAVQQDPTQPGFGGHPFNADAVCWTADPQPLRRGGHLADGLGYLLPNDHQGGSAADGQPDWRFCPECHGLFHAPAADSNGSVCPAGGVHHPVGFRFFLPTDRHGATTSTGQPDWRRCTKCRGLFHAPADGAAGSVCPAGGSHQPDGARFFLPVDRKDATASTGQADWRRCRNCCGLFWNGRPAKGVCAGSGGGGVRLTAVVDDRGLFDPFRVEGEIGVLGTNETPTGAFSHGGRVYVFVWVGERPGGIPAAGSYLVSKDDPGRPGPYRREAHFSPLRFDGAGFWQVAPVIVNNGQHPGLPQATGTGLVMFGHGFDARLGEDAIHLAWMPLTLDATPPAGTRYFIADGAELSWDADQASASALFARPGYTSVSAAWLEAPQRWILLYSHAHPTERPDGPVVARTGRLPWELSDEIVIFDPRRDEAYGRYMHLPGSDTLHPDVPPPQPPGLDQPGWAYGAHLIPRYTEWDPVTGELGVFYLLSTASPYQVQLMHSRIRLT
jgi:hypothetical protein